MIKVLKSSSKGNAYLIKDGVSTLLLECGITYKELIKNDVKLSKIDGCLITHEHQDHSSGADFIVEFTNIYATAGTIKGLKNVKKYSYRLKQINVNKQFCVGTFKIVAFEIKHDANEPVGFLIYSTVNKKKLLFATDTYFIKNRFKGLNYIMVECSFSSELLEKAVEDGKIHKSIAKRLYKSHFELGNVIKFLLAQDLSRLEAVYLMHLSSGLSNEKDFKYQIQKAIGKPVYVCKE